MNASDAKALVIEHCNQHQEQSDQRIQNGLTVAFEAIKIAASKGGTKTTITWTNTSFLDHEIETVKKELMRLGYTIEESDGISVYTIVWE